MIYDELCLEQADIIDRLVAQNKRLVQLLSQFIDVTKEEKRLSELERRINPHGSTNSDKSDPDSDAS